MRSGGDAYKAFEKAGMTSCDLGPFWTKFWRIIYSKICPMRRSRADRFAKSLRTEWHLSLRWVIELTVVLNP